MVSLGGNIQAIGTKPDGSSWRVGIRDPKGSQQDYAGVLQVQNEAVVTSGGYERYFEEDGRTYIHIIDPRTGYPVENDLLSVTIVSPDGTLADGLLQPFILWAMIRRFSSGSSTRMNLM